MQLKSLRRKKYPPIHNRDKSVGAAEGNDYLFRDHETTHIHSGNKRIALSVAENGTQA